MTENLSQLDEQLRSETDTLIYKEGLHNILTGYGIPYYTGSYQLHLMTWRDLDIYLQTDDLPEEKFFDLGTRIAHNITR